VKCDAGPLNGVYGSGCSKDCQLCGYCGDGKIDDEAGEQCRCFERNPFPIPDGFKIFS
jgi:hypothetical protein